MDNERALPPRRTVRYPPFTRNASATGRSAAPPPARARARAVPQKPVCRCSGTRLALVCGSPHRVARRSSRKPFGSCRHPFRYERLRSGRPLRMRRRTFRESTPSTPGRAAVPCAWTRWRGVAVCGRGSPGKVRAELVFGEHDVSGGVGSGPGPAATVGNLITRRTRASAAGCRPR